MTDESKVAVHAEKGRNSPFSAVEYDRALSTWPQKIGQRIESGELKIFFENFFLIVLIFLIQIDVFSAHVFVTRLK